MCTSLLMARWWCAIRVWYGVPWNRLWLYRLSCNMLPALNCAVPTTQLITVRCRWRDRVGLCSCCVSVWIAIIRCAVKSWFGTVRETCPFNKLSIFAKRYCNCVQPEILNYKYKLCRSVCPWITANTGFMYTIFLKFYTANQVSVISFSVPCTHGRTCCRDPWYHM